MSDLVERLRDPIVCVLPDGCENLDLLKAAADRIEALEAALREARAKALKEAAQHAFDQTCDDPAPGDWNEACRHVSNKIRALEATDDRA